MPIMIQNEWRLEHILMDEAPFLKDFLVYIRRAILHQGRVPQTLWMKNHRRLLPRVLASS